MKKILITALGASLAFAACQEKKTEQKTEEPTDHVANTSETPESSPIQPSVDTVAMEENTDTSTQVDAQVTKLKLAEMKLEDYIKLDTKEKILAQFDKSETEEGESYYAEGTVKYNHTLVTNPATTNEVKYLWNEDNSLSSVEISYIKYDKNFTEKGIQMLGSTNGIHLGMKLDKLVEWNEAPITFTGFGWDFGGTIMKAENSKIATCGYILTLEVKSGEATPKGVYGDIELKSTDEVLSDADVFISKITYYNNSESN